MINFWRTTGEYGFMSNFSKHPIEIDGKRYETTEHYYQAMKATNEDDHERVRKAKGPKKCKDLAQTIDLRSDWEDIKYEIMKNALRAKVARYEFMKESLLESGDQEIAEASPYDYIWGTGKDGTGQNLLGKSWMEIREELRQNAATA